MIPRTPYSGEFLHREQMRSVGFPVMASVRVSRTYPTPVHCKHIMEPSTDIVRSGVPRRRSPNVRGTGTWTVEISWPFPPHRVQGVLFWPGINRNYTAKSLTRSVVCSWGIAGWEIGRGGGARLVHCSPSQPTESAFPHPVPPIKSVSPLTV